MMEPLVIYPRDPRTDPPGLGYRWVLAAPRSERGIPHTVRNTQVRERPLAFDWWAELPPVTMTEHRETFMRKTSQLNVTIEGEVPPPPTEEQEGVLSEDDRRVLETTARIAELEPEAAAEILGLDPSILSREVRTNIPRVGEEASDDGEP